MSEVRVGVGGIVCADRCSKWRGEEGVEGGMMER